MSPSHQDGTAPPARRSGSGPAPTASPVPGGPVHHLLPNFCSLPVAVAVVLYAQLLALLLALASPSPLGSLWERLGPMSLLVLMVALVTATVLCLLRRPMRGLDVRLAALISWCLIVGIAVTVAAAAIRLLPWGDDAGLFPADGTVGLLLRAALIAAIVGALLLRYLYLHAQWRAQVVAVANARFQTLQARIRPHFLFNSMNTIASLIPSNPALAEAVLEDLADLFRASLDNKRTTTLAQEIELSRRYLHIESQRLGTRMRVDWDLLDLPGEACMPPLILQPLVENAVYHGIQPSAEPGRVRIVGRYRRGMVNLSIRNSLPPPGSSTRASEHTGNQTPTPGSRRPDAHTGNQMALLNVTQRMDAMFPGLARVSQTRIDGDYVVRLAFPFARGAP